MRLIDDSNGVPMSVLNILLTVVLALATVVQAGVLWLERRTPLENALYDRQISAALQAAEAISEKCRLRFVPHVDAPKQQEDWVNMMVKRRQAQFTLKLVASNELLALLGQAYIEEDVFDSEKYWKKQDVAVKQSFGKSMGKGHLSFWGCSEIADAFLTKARQLFRLDVTSEAMREKLSRPRSEDLPIEPPTPKE